MTDTSSCIRTIVIGIFVLGLLMVLAGCSDSGKNDDRRTYKQISMDEAAKMISEQPDLLIVDVRAPEEYAEGHIPKAINIPLETIEWTALSYVRDAVTLGYAKAVINIGHFSGEELGMAYARDWLKELTEDTQLLILLNPNNPMGNVYSNQEFETIMKACREKKITVLVDEAYHYFYPKTFIKYALDERHVFITRTFSKLFSMAGCRLGYVVGHPDDIKYVQKFCTPHNTNAFAMKFAEAIIEEPGMVDGLIQRFTEGRKYLIDTLDAKGYRHKGKGV